MIEHEKLILVTNDDGYRALGIRKLVEMLRPMGRVVVVAPDSARSGQSHAVTLGTPLYLRKVEEAQGYTMFACSGTPADCVKIALHKVLDRMPDLVVSGINHGSNAAVNVLYSGTVGASTEGAFHGLPSVAFSLDDHSPNADFEATLVWAKRVVEQVLAKGMAPGVSLNVNVPKLAADQIKGMRVCRMTAGRWIEEFEHRVSPHGQDYYWLTGQFINFEPESRDTDVWAMDNGYVAVVPIQNDLTAHAELSNFDFLNQ